LPVKKPAPVRPIGINLFYISILQLRSGVEIREFLGGRTGKEIG